MELFEAIAKRHSYRGEYQNKPVSRDDLIRIVQAGIQAPSGKNLQTTRFVIIDNPDQVGQIGSLHATMKSMQQAKAFIACILDKNPDPREAFSFHVEDCAAAVENMLLAITALGYATVWIDGWLRLDHHAETIGRLLEVPDEKIVRVLLPIGIPAEIRLQREKFPFAERASFNRYGSTR